VPDAYPYLQNIRKGDFARAKVNGKRAIELGAGMGLAGLALAMLGTFQQQLCQAAAILPIPVLQMEGAKQLEI
jgi:hypothetical protein